jgi:hypothetical protein
MQNEFSIKLNRETGFGDLFVKTCSKEEDIEECIEANSNYAKNSHWPIEKHTSGNQASQIEMSKEAYPDLFCTYCYYIIKVFAEDFDLHGTINILLD